MTKTIPYVTKLVKNGNSYHVAIPANIKKDLHLEKGDIVKIEISPLLDQFGEPKKIRNAVFETLSHNQSIVA